jgi:hypothetical protein
MKKLSVQEVLSKISTKYPHVTKIDTASYRDTQTRCRFFDDRPNAGWFETKPVYLLSGQTSGHPYYNPRRKLSCTEVLRKIQERFPYVSEIDQRSFTNTGSLCLFFDARAGGGWFSAKPIYLMTGNQSGHPRLNKRQKRSSEIMLEHVRSKYPHITEIKEFLDSSKKCSFFDSREGRGWFKCRPNDLITGRQSGKPAPGYAESEGEKELFEYVLSVVPDAIRHHKIGTMELDVFIPSLRVGVEFNGLYWHSEKFKPRNFHRDRTNKCEAAGIRLLHVFEHEWKYRKPQVKSFLRSALGANTERIGARECVFRECDGPEARMFLEAYHVQGAPRSLRYAVACEKNGQLLGVATFGAHHRRGGSEIILNRFAFRDGTTVSGALSKMSLMASRKFGRDLYTWADLAKSQARGYLAAGWIKTDVLPPDYFYATSSGKAVSKQSRKKSRAGTPPGMTESKHAEADGLVRIWDCGKVKLVFRRLNNSPY